MKENRIDYEFRTTVAPGLEKEDIITDQNTMALPKQLDFNIKSFKMTIVVEDNEMNPIRLKEQTMISRTFELTIDALSFSLKFKREMINNVLIIKIVSFLKMKSFLFQAEEIGDSFVFCDLETTELHSEYTLKENKGDKITIINIKNTFNVFFLFLIYKIFLNKA